MLYVHHYSLHLQTIMTQIVKTTLDNIFLYEETTRPLHIYRQHKTIIIPNTLIIIKFSKRNNNRKWLGRKVKVNHTQSWKLGKHNKNKTWKISQSTIDQCYQKHDNTTQCWSQNRWHWQQNGIILSGIFGSRGWRGRRRRPGGRWRNRGKSWAEGGTDYGGRNEDDMELLPGLAMAREATEKVQVAGFCKSHRVGARSVGGHCWRGVTREEITAAHLLHVVKLAVVQKYCKM